MTAQPSTVRVDWPRAVRIIRSRFPPIPLFEDIADPTDWDLLNSAETKTNPRIAETIGRLDLVPIERRVSGPNASYVMAPFTHVSTDRPSRFSNGTYGVYYCANRTETAIFETIYHHERFLHATSEPPGWCSEYRELAGTLHADVHDIRDGHPAWRSSLDPDDYAAAQILGAQLRAAGSDGIIYPSVRDPGGTCAGLFWPDVPGVPDQASHYSYHWDGDRVDQIQNLSTGELSRVCA
ncbi:MAG: RES family NAD+ phosphorylase [Hyphomicrobiales bacterium]|nr:RES family NAD+ phosphorylase [Hyphomicrobiales bacterium]